MKGGPDSSEEAQQNGRKRASVSSPTDKQSQKRSRVSRACDQCRASREKCDGTQPVCQTCTSQRRDCSYHEQPKKRGIQPNYIRTLELTLAWLFRTYPDGESKLATSLAASDDDTVRHLIAGKEGQSEALHQKWRNSIICRQIDQMLSGGTIERPSSVIADNLPSIHRTQVNDSDSEHLLHPDALLQTHLGSRADQPYGEQSFHPYLDPELTAHINAVVPVRQKLPQNAWTLLEYYFAFTHAWIPITDKQEMLKLMYSFPTDGLSNAELVSTGYAELWSIMALAGTQMRHADSGLDCARLAEVANSSIPLQYDRCELSHVKALLLLSVLEFTNKKWLAAWLLVGTAVRLTVALTAGPNALASRTALQGLLDQNGNDASQHATIKLITLAAFIVESAIASCLGVNPHMRPDQVKAIGLVPEEGLEEWAPWNDPLGGPSLAKAPSKSFSTLNRLVRTSLGCFDERSNLHCMQNVISSRGAGQQHNYTSVSDEATIPGPVTWTSDIHRTVSALIQNATQPTRLQPVEIVTRCESVLKEGLGDSIVPAGPSQAALNAPLQHGLGYMSIPTNNSGETTFSTSPALGNEANGSWITPQAANQLSDLASLDGAAPGVDIFEELAMLERTDSNQNPQFMQNLGFAPDIDLAEFFGADYQPSDPLLAYMQPSLFNGAGGPAQQGAENDMG